MVYTVHIRRTADGEVRKRVEPDEWDEGCEFLWNGGNYGCDCNRALFFARAGDEDDPADRSCGLSAFCIRITTPEGAVVYDEW